MEVKARSSLKAELKQELSEEIRVQVEAEVEEEIEKLHRGRQYINYAKMYFFAIAATIIALGQFSEAITLIEDGMDWTLSKFTNDVEYELLSKIHVGNTQSYINDLYGNPKFSRSIGNNIIANYFDNNKFLLTVFLSEKRVVAFTYLPLENDFKPETQKFDGHSLQLQDFRYTDYPANPQKYLIDHSKTVSYYLESLDTGRSGLFFKTYLGHFSMNPETTNALIVELYNKEVNASDEAILKAQGALRSQTNPNLFGMGLLPLEQIQKSLLTGAEFHNYFGH